MKSNFFYTLNINSVFLGLNTNYLGQFIFFGSKQFSFKVASRFLYTHAHFI